VRKRNLFLASAVVVGTSLMVLWPAGSKSSAASKAPQSMSVSVSDFRPLAFSFDQVVSYFDDAFERSARRMPDETCVYIEGNAPDESIILAVSSRESKIVITLLTNGDWGVNYIREFFEAPFFLQSESEQLYALLYANPGARGATLGRFDVEIDVVETREWIIITAEFGSPGSYEVPLIRPARTAQLQFQNLLNGALGGSK
jgi:hypothetical protein